MSRPAYVTALNPWNNPAIQELLQETKIPELSANPNKILWIGRGVEIRLISRQCLFCSDKVYTKPARSAPYSLREKVSFSCQTHQKQETRSIRDSLSKITFRISLIEKLKQLAARLQNARPFQPIRSDELPYFSETSFTLPQSIKDKIHYESKIHRHILNLALLSVVYQKTVTEIKNFYPDLREADISTFIDSMLSFSVDAEGASNLVALESAFQLLLEKYS